MACSKCIYFGGPTGQTSQCSGECKTKYHEKEIVITHIKTHYD